MSVPPIPPPLEHLGERPFSFYPPILGIEHNEWTFRQATWSEILVHNTKSGNEIWVPRRFVGEVSRIDEPVMIVGLLKELEYKAGGVWPAARRVLEMPRGAGSKPADSADQAQRAEPHARSMIDIAREGGAESRSLKLFAIVLLAGIVLAIFGVMMTREDKRIEYRAVLQSDLGLTGRDDYFAVVRRLGQPTEDRWKSETGELQYRLLGYPQRGLYIILMGTERNKVLYIGSLDKNWRVVDSVELPNGKNTASMLRQLKRF